MGERFGRETARIAPTTATPVLVEIEAEYIPLLFSALRKYHNQSFWQSSVDYTLGKAGIIRLERALLTDMTQPIVDAIDRLYRLIDRSYNGTDYFVRVNPDGSQSVDPPIDIVPPASADSPNAMRAHLGRLWQLAENSTRGAVFPAGAGIAGSGALDDERSVRDTLRDAQGIINAGWFGWGGRRATLADLIASLKIGSDGDQGVINNALEEILNAGGNSSGIINTVRGLFDTAANTTLEGGQLGVLLASSIANAAIAGATAAQLDQLRAELVAVNEKLIDRDQGLHITDWVKSTRAVALEIRNSIRVGADETTIQELLQSILAALGTNNGGDSQQLAEIISVLETIRATISPQGPEPQLNLYYLVDGILAAARCICDAVGGENTPPPATPPEYDASACGREALLCVWRPTESATPPAAPDGGWTISFPNTVGGGIGNGPDGESLFFIDQDAGQIEVGIYADYAQVGEAMTFTLSPRVRGGGSGPAGRPDYSWSGQTCQTVNIYGRGAQDQIIGYALFVGPATDAENPITPQNVAVFVSYDQVA